jgi:hypothetical protein
VHRRSALLRACQWPLPCQRPAPRPPLPPPAPAFQPQMLPPFKPAVDHSHLPAIAGLTQLDALALSVQARRGAATRGVGPRWSGAGGGVGRQGLLSPWDGVLPCRAVQRSHPCELAAHGLLTAARLALRARRPSPHTHTLPAPPHPLHRAASPRGAPTMSHSRPWARSRASPRCRCTPSTPRAARCPARCGASAACAPSTSAGALWSRRRRGWGISPRWSTSM